MTESLAQMTDIELEAALRDLGHMVEPPPATHDLAHAVRLRTEAVGAARAERGTWRLPLLGRPVRRSLVLALAALILLAGLAVAVGIGLPGLRFVFLESPTPTVPASPGGAAGSSAAPSPTPVRTPTPIAALDLGRAVAIGDLDGEAGFDALLPTLPELGQPAGAFVDGSGPFATVNVVYPPTLAFPGRPDEAASILISEFRGTIDPAYFEKIIGAGTTVEQVAVGGSTGYWISGDPHEIYYVDVNGQPRPDRVHLAANVLAWTEGDLTLRIEGAHDLQSALRIATSMH